MQYTMRYEVWRALPIANLDKVLVFVDLEVGRGLKLFVFQ